MQGTSKINLEQFTINLKIVSAKINYSSGIAEVRVKRNPGEGNLTGIKFIVEDPRTTEVFEERFIRFEELAEKTFNIDLLISGTDLIIYEIEKISIAPIYVAGSGISESLGSISDSISGVKELNINGSEETTEENESQTGEECITNLDCGEDYFIEGTRACDIFGNVVQYKKTFECENNLCNLPKNVLTTKELCSTETTCLEGYCITEPIACTNETITTDCGIDDWIGITDCQINPEAIIQNFRTYFCNEGFCESITETRIKEECIEDEICYGGECLEALECTQNSDCIPGKICKEGNCEIEIKINNGSIRSIWPFGIGEYFDSFDLPLESANISVGQYIIFPESSQAGCLQIKEFFPATFEEGISYIRLNTASTNISDGDNYEIWETDYICSLQ